MSWADFPSGPGQMDGPTSSDNYKRAVYRPPPSMFTVEMLAPTKHGGSYSYGMRIHRITRGDRGSISSRGSYSEYEIWRRWEDCLWFQDTIEMEYRRMAREKRQRLLRGKGVRKGEFYQQDQASSFESLPPGPDPSSVAHDIHMYVPQLTKKGTMFRASQATIDQRARELSALVSGLFQDGVPALVDELRNDRIVTDFFGFWRRDHDLAEKQKSRATKVRSSVTSSVFSMYFSSSNPAIHAQSYPESSLSDPRPPSPVHTPRKAFPSIAMSDITEEPRYPCSKSISDTSGTSSDHFSRRRTSSATSSDFSSAHSDRSSDSSPNTSVSVIADDVPVLFGHNPQHMLERYTSGCPSSDLETLPEDHVVSHKHSVQDFISPPTKRSRDGPARDSRENRNCRIFPSQNNNLCRPGTTITEENLLTLADRSVRDSWQTTDSSFGILDGIDMTLPPSPTEYNQRASMSSIATFMTDCSADAVVPRSPRSPFTNRSNMSSARSRISCPVSISEDDDWSDLEDGAIGSYLADAFPLPCFDIPYLAPDIRPETPSRHIPEPEYEESTTSFPSVPPSPTTSTAFSVSTEGSDSPGSKLSIKAAYNDSIVVLRVSCDCYAEMRQRLYNKFVGQEGMPLPVSFSVAFILPTQPTQIRGRSHSIPSIVNHNHMQFVSSQGDWEKITTSLDSCKLTLRIFDNTPS